MMAVLERAAARGEAHSEISPRVARVPLDLIRHELILNPSTVPANDRGDRRRGLPAARAPDQVTGTARPAPAFTLRS